MNLYNSTDFTINAWEALYDAVDSAYFQDKDADLIYTVLENKLKFISFGEYLKRYIYRKAVLTQPYDDVPLKTYQQIIMESFRDNHTPRSFDPTTAKLSALSKNWLTQQAVKRKVVFLLGFGLAMSADDVNEFLTKALREQGVNAKNPFEVICWYCYKNGYGYLKYEKLWKIYCDTPPNSLDITMLYADLTIGARNTMQTIHNDTALLAYVSRLKAQDNQPKQSVTARVCFDRLLETSKELAADLYNRSDRAGRRVYRSCDITESDLEHIISSAIPVDRHGNLVPSKASKLYAQFDGKRFSRQHIGDILAGKTEVTRFDLITLNFFIYSQTIDKYRNTKARYTSFVDTTNQILDICQLERLYIANPYECFVLMCILSDDPLGTYADVWEMSYASSV